MTLKRYAEQRTRNFSFLKLKRRQRRRCKFVSQFNYRPLRKTDLIPSSLSFLTFISAFLFRARAKQRLLNFEHARNLILHACEAKNSMAITRQVGKFITRFLPLTRATVQHPSECFSFPSVKYKAVSRNVCNLLGEVDFQTSEAWNAVVTASTDFREDFILNFAK